MRLALTFPESFSQLPGDANGVVNYAPEDQQRLTVSIAPMEPTPLDGEAYITRVLAQDLPKDAQLVIQRRVANQTVTGFPMLLIHSEFRSADGSLFETRFTAIYSMLAVNAAAFMRARNSDDGKHSASALFNQYEETVKTILRSAVPEWETGVCTISSYYEGLPALWERK